MYTFIYVCLHFMDGYYTITFLISQFNFFRTIFLFAVNIFGVVSHDHKSILILCKGGFLVKKFVACKISVLIEDHKKFIIQPLLIHLLFIYLFLIFFFMNKDASIFVKTIVSIINLTVHNIVLIIPAPSLNSTDMYGFRLKYLPTSPNYS